MKTYKHVTSGELAELFSENTKAVILKFEDGTKKEVAQITFRRWWKLVEDKPEETASEATTEDKSMKMSDVIDKLENLFNILNKAYFSPFDRI